MVSLGKSHQVLKERMVEAMSESAVAIFITSMTDVFSFAIGCWTDIIAVRGFCAMTSACMFFTFLYQVLSVTFTDTWFWISYPEVVYDLYTV